MPLPRSVQDLASVLPDLPRWVETRALLLSGRVTIMGSDDGEAAVVLNDDKTFGALVGRVDHVLAHDALAEVPVDFELLVQMDAVRAAHDVLASWRVAPAVVHTLPTPFPTTTEPADLDVVVSSAPPHGTLLDDLPEDVRLDAGEADTVAVRVADGAVVAVCAAGDVTETWWDVGIDTIEDHRRQGHAAACFRALAAVMARRGKQPVWSAYADYPPSLALAAKLGFRAIDQVAVLSPNLGASP